MSDFWQASDKSIVINLEHIVGMTRKDDALHIISSCPGVTMTVTGQAEQELLVAIARRMGLTK